MNTRRIILYALIAVIFLVINFSKALVNLFTDWLWFKEVGYVGVFTSILGLKIEIAAIASFVFFIFLYANLLIAKKMAPPFPYWFGSQNDPLHEVLKFIKSPTFMRFFNIILFAIAAVFAIGVGASAVGYWNIVLKYLNQVPFGIKDPTFGLDIAFHIFSIPFYRGLLGLGFQAVVLAIILTATVHWINGGITFRPGMERFAPHTKAHLSVLFGVFFVLLGISFKLNSYDLLLSDVGVIYGAGYTDIHAKLPALTILFYSSVIAAILFLVNIYFKGWKLPIASITFIMAVSIIVGGIYPAIVQQYKVSPNEIEKETPYIKQAIKFTNRAYELDKIKEKQFPAEQELNKADLDNNKQTIDNIRLWDWQPLSKTFKQIQSIRLYYDFVDVDVDRYLIDGNYRQVAISARELNIDNLPEKAKTWVNEHLVYTHGYGIVANKVNEFTEDGLPKLAVKDIPPKADTDSLEVTSPEIYFGEVTNDYIIVGTKTREFDYPMGNENKYTKYQGSGGIKLDNLPKKAAFAWRFNSLKLLLSDSLTSDSQIIFNRNIIERAKLIAPFLEYESDPYIVVDKGKLYWILDAYTTEGRYPYSQPFNGQYNYIRNSVKIVVNAYNGSIRYYIFDDKDPLIQTYKKAFPELFKNGSDMPASLAAHIKYPEALFKIQSQMFATFHMADPQVFYNKEDLWNIPKEVVSGKQKDIEPYYMVMKLPGEDREKFMIMTPFTPINKNNMIAWMTVKCDPEEYGQMLVYKFPKQKLIYGPMQIEARIDQTPDISQQLSLWDQRGSSVIRGNLFVIPIEDSLLYVEPLYLQAKQTELPELKRVIVSYGPKIVMAENLGSALETIFGKGKKPAQAPPTTIVDTPTEALTGSLKELAERASQHFENAQKKQREGDWTGYGEELKRLEKALADLKERASQ
ncbi:MAG: UPF0182 family protein [Actinobacteria bacterium]|nr:UPF0182 family protein [Actinomycetota bacterium]